MQGNHEFVLSDRSSDGVTAVRFGGAGGNKLAVSSWDTVLRVYDPVSGGEKSLLGEVKHQVPLLDVVWVDAGRLAAAGADGNVTLVDLEGGRPQCVGQHEMAVKSLAVAQEQGLLFSGSFDRSVKAFDLRSASAEVQTYAVAEKVLTMDCRDHTLIVGATQRSVLVYDVRSMAKPVADRKSSLAYQTRSIKIFPDATGYALACIEGRVAIEYFHQTAKKTNYAFKCHRDTVDGIYTAYPVNCLAFHPTYGTFVTGGCDGVVAVWDADNKKRIKQYPKYPTSIASLDFSLDGNILAIASSYTWEQGQKDSPPDEVFIRPVASCDVKPRVATSTSTASSAPKRIR